jgi:hypothetical protein
MGSFPVNTGEIQAPVAQAIDLIGCCDFIFCENSRKCRQFESINLKTPI